MSKRKKSRIVHLTVSLHQNISKNLLGKLPLKKYKKRIIIIIIIIATTIIIIIIIIIIILIIHL